MGYGRFILVLALLHFFPLTAWGNDFRLMPSISVKEEYNSNILLSPNADSDSDFITTLSPGVRMSDQTARWSTDLSVHLDQLEYANDHLSSINQMYDGKFQYQATPLLGISAGAGYTRNSNPALTIDKTGFAIAAVPWVHVSSSLSANWQLTEKTAVSASYVYGDDYFESPGYAGDSSHDFSVDAIHDLTRYIPRLKARMNATYGRYYFSGSVINNLTGTAGFSRDLTEIWSIQADAGIRRTWSEISVTQLSLLGYTIQNGQVVPVYKQVNEQIGNSGLGWVTDLSLDYKGERGNADLTFVRSIIPAYGQLGAAERNYLTLDANYQFTSELSAILTASYSTSDSNPSEFSVNGIRQRFFQVQPGFRYEFSRDIAAVVSYGFTKVRDDIAGTEADRHLFSVSLNMRQSVLE